MYSEDEKRWEMESISSKIRIPTIEKKKGIHSEYHELAYKCRKQFNETAKKGKGSFTFYLGFIRKLGLTTTYKILAEMKETGNEDAGKLFWWKVKKEFERRKNK